MICEQIRTGIRTRDEYAQFRTRMNDIDGDVYMDALALFACPDQYTP